MKSNPRWLFLLRSLYEQVRIPGPLWVAGALAILPWSRLQGAEFQQTTPTPGGVSPFPKITSVEPVPGKNSLLIRWIGVQAPYQLQVKSTLGDGTWTDVGAPVDTNQMVVPTTAGNGFHRIAGAAPGYVGADVCAECHGDKVAAWSGTRHGHAYQTLKNIKQQENPACVVCHTVGAGTSSGFASEAKTPHLVNVQCENCHGPAGDHVGSGESPTVFPMVVQSAVMCGGCHNDFHHPNYDEWNSSAHSRVIADLVGDFSSTNRATATARMSTCGPCHSGAVRLAMMNAYESFSGLQRTNVNWPSGNAATNIAQACVVCHDPHEAHVYTNVVTGLAYTNQLRFPLTSTNDFSYNTANSFASQYNPQVNVCGQCHNARGATVGSSSRPPHYSPQYNIYLGTIGVTSTNNPPQGAHRNNPRQCAGCHTHRHDADGATAEKPAFTGHSFRPTVQACMECHKETEGPLSATNRLFSVQSEVVGLISDTKNMLDLWATTKNTNAWASKYEARGWEFTSPGELSNPSGSTTIVGPSSTEQAGIPQGIKDARFNLYLVNRDKSRGVHNAPYVRHLLITAKQKVQAELARP